MAQKTAKSSSPNSSTQSDSARLAVAAVKPKQNTMSPNLRFLPVGILIVALLVIGYFLITSLTSRTVSAPLKLQATPMAQDNSSVINTSDDQNGSVAGGTAVTYTVKAGDNLWSIAQAYFGTGYAWNQIAQANNLQSPNTIHVGDMLVLQGTTKYPLTNNQTANGQSSSPMQGSYTVIRGDTLWSIAQRAYNNPFKWQTIAMANKITMPRKLAVGAVLAIPPLQ